MNKAEWMRDLTSLVAQRQNIDGAINYITNKIGEIDRLEIAEKEKERLKEVEK